MANLFPKSVRKAVFQRCAAMMAAEDNILSLPKMSDQLQDVSPEHKHLACMGVLKELDRQSLQ